MALTHTIKITRGSVAMLTSMLSQPGWYEKGDHLYIAGEMLERPEFELPKAPTNEDPIAVHKEWGLTPVQFDVTEKQRDAIKACLQSFIGKKGLPPGRYANGLMAAFGLAPEA